MIDSNKSKNMFFGGQWLTMSVIMITLSAFLMLGSTGSADPGTVVDVPDFEVDVVFSHWGTESYWDTTISGIGGREEGYNVWDDTWVGWCVDEYHYIYPGTHYDVTLYSSYDPGMPWPDSNWDMVNYVINHKHPDATKQDIQDAVWCFINGEKGYPSDPEAQAMVDEAIANGEGFVPQPVPFEGQKCAVLCDAGDTVQGTFMEVLVSPDIVYVDDDFDDTTLGWGYDHFDSIMDGVIAVADCGTVYVAAGTYTEQVIIDKSLELLGDPGATIMAPDLRNTYTIDESSNTFDPIIFAYGGTLAGDHVSGTQTISVKIDGFEIDGGNKASVSPRFVAILYRNIQPGCTLSQISNNAIHRMYDADGQGNGPQTIGIVIYGDSEVTIVTNDISEFSRLGIGAIGDNGPNNPEVVIEDNTVTGNGLESGTNWWAENGIQISVGAGGDIIENIVSDCQVNNPSWVSSGILVDDAANGVSILENDVTLCDTGISIRSPSFDIIDGNSVNYCNWDALRLGWPTDNATVTNNILTDSLWGIYNADASDNLMEYNLLQNNVYGIGIDGDSHNNFILHNDILDNDEYGVYFETYYATPSGNEIHYNNIAGNGLSGVENIDLPHNVDAICNWWGHCSGPTHATTNPLGCGDAVSDNVDYLPWLDTAYPGGNCIGGLCQDQVYVDDDFGCPIPGWNIDHFATIQTGIDRVCDGGTVYVYDGTYAPFKVEGRNDISITMASLPIITGNQFVYDTTYSGFVNNVVFVNNSQNIDIIGFEIQGTNPGGRDYTVLYQSSSGMVKDCIVDSNSRGNMNALAIRAHVNSVLTIEDCTIRDYGRIGIYCRQGTTMYIYDNTLIGQTYSSADGDYVNYGIEIEDLSSKSHAEIIGNEIYGHDYSDNPSWSSAGIIVDAWRYYMVTDENCSAIIEQNDIHDNYFGIEIVPNDDIHVNCNNIYDNRWYGAISSPYYDGMQYVNYTLDANCNWWGDCSGPYNDTLNPYGQGDQVDDYVDFDPWVGKITVDAGGPYYNEDEPYTIYFDGSYTTSGCCGEVVTIEWDFGDGDTSDEIDPTHNYPNGNGYTATLTITTETTIGSHTHICSESDTAIVNVQDDPPIVQLEYPRGGEELSGTINIQWFAIDSEDWGSPYIWLYYTADGGDSWVRIAKDLSNTLGDGTYKDRGEYSWSAGSLPDGNYIVRIYAYDSAGNLAIDSSKPFIIGTRTTGLTVSYVTVGSSNAYIKDGDSLEINAGITFGQHISADYVTADLSGLGKGTSVPADSFDGLTAIWTIDDVVCNPSDGPIIITVTATDGGNTDSNTATIIADNTIPGLNVITPDNALYFLDKKLFSLNKPIIIGAITLEATADDSSSGVQKTEIYIDDELKETFDYSSEWYMNLRLMGRHTLKIVAYDNAGNVNEYSRTVIIINPFGEK